jgi:hypothetical protein
MLFQTFLNTEETQQFRASLSGRDAADETGSASHVHRRLWPMHTASPAVNCLVAMQLALSTTPEFS